MKIVHIAPNAPYNDYWGYQENIMPKEHKKLGHDVTLIVSNTTHSNGGITETECMDYVDKNGIRIIRKAPKKYKSNILTNITTKMNIDLLLEEIMPDFIFFHGVTSATIHSAIKYKKKNKNCIIVQDSHVDYYNGYGTRTIKHKMLRAFFRARIRFTKKHISKYYGVTPWRAQYLEDYFKTPPTKTAVLVMGGDDDHIHLDKKQQIRAEIREKLNIEEDVFTVITGGKIDKTKNFHLLMEAVSEIEGNIKLVVFGQPDMEMQAEIKKYEKNTKIQYIGWLKAEDTYDYFLAADLAVFPGTHSVIWEQACACGIPIIVKKWDGMQHVDVGGNCKFLTENSTEEIKSLIQDIFENEDKYKAMKISAEKGIDVFSYNSISKRVLEVSE